MSSKRTEEGCKEGSLGEAPGLFVRTKQILNNYEAKDNELLLQATFWKPDAPGYSANVSA